jgi:diguanylate cyclase (GGDEF)-like protein
MDGKKYLYSIVHDITERIEAEEETRRLNEELLRISRTDKLTGIFNRAYLEEILCREIDKAKRYQTCLSLIMFDLDNYKNINDSLGHLAGDMVLRRVADAVNANVRNSDFLARWGGDEFMILTPMRLSSALKFAEKLRSVIENLHCGVTASFGVAEFSREDTLDQLTRRVDRALYRAKDKGRNRVCSYED